ncbi:DUF2474 domain-containing protein [Variovorax sp. Root318D1]|uniref:DUF2474 domain-containing protein n=1 Tax=Variovorax sp. Root318D1 TaxID=1736513 RepID=UPI002E0D8087
MATTDAPGSGRRKWLRRLGWLAAIWLASVVSLYLLALVLRFLMNAVGLSH